MSARFKVARQKWHDWKDSKSRATSSTQYHPLEESQIRLLSIENGEGELRAQLSCHFLENAPEYYAISYAWTHEPLSAVIECDGSPLHLTPDLLDALTTMSSGMFPGCQFWVDAICIAQNNPKEKAKQVQQIHEVFQRADEVLIWLGPAADDSEIFINSIDDFWQSLQPLSWHTSVSLRDFQKRIWRALFALCGRRWFCRVWTYQEVYLAKDASLYCGQEHCQLDPLIQLLYFINAHGFLYHLMYAFATGCSHAGLYSRISKLVVDFQRRHQEYPLTFVLDRSENRDCTEPVDRIYGLLGMVQASVRSSITIDYTKRSRTEYWKLWALAARLALQEPGSERFHTLESCDRVLVDEHLPTWCPNWASTPRLRKLTMSKWNESNDDVSGHRFFTGKLHCAGTVSPLVRPWPNNISFPRWNVLRIRGVIVDEVAIVLDRPPSWSRLDWFRPGMSQTMRKLGDYFESCKWLYDKQEKHPDTVEYQGLKGEIMAHTFLALREDVSPAAATFEQVVAATCAFVDSEFGQPHSPVSWCLDRLDEVWPGRVFFVTKQGRPGVGSRSIRAGDKVCVFFGGDPCYVLRKHSSGQHWQLKHEAYVHGLMSFGVSFMLDRGEVHDEYFDII